MADGLPVAHHVFVGNTADKKTVEFIISDLSKRFELRNIVFIADKGITTSENIKKLDETGYKYILGVSLRNCDFAKDILKEAKNLIWEEYNGDTKYVLFNKKDAPRLDEKR